MRSCVVAAFMAAAAVPQPGAPSVQDRRPHPHDSKDRLRRAILPGALCGSLSEVYRMQSSGVLQQRGQPAGRTAQVLQPGQLLICDAGWQRA